MVEEIYKDRDKFAQTVQAVSAQDMRNMGLQIISFTIKNIHDQEGYLDSLGKARTAEVKRDAEIGQAQATRDAAIASAKARQEGETDGDVNDFHLTPELKPDMSHPRHC